MKAPVAVCLLCVAALPGRTEAQTPERKTWLARSSRLDRASGLEIRRNAPVATPVRHGSCFVRYDGREGRGGGEAMFTALVVDDDAAFRLALGEILLLEGYRTLSASTCREALVHLEAGAADLLFVDLNLPDGSGLDLLPRAEPPAVVVTGETSLFLADATLRLGARDCLTKPVDRLRVRMTLAHIARERRLQEDVARLSHEVGSLRAGTLLR